MAINNKILAIKQLDKKAIEFQPLLKSPPPAQGWISLIRRSLNMTLRQLGDRLNITPQSTREIEIREATGTISINALSTAAEALNMQLVYGFIPKDGSLEMMIEKRARAIATKIVSRTATSMKLEDQENSKARLSEAIEEMTLDLKRELSSKLWD
ncbi:mobile mystery protein A [Chitinophaga sp. sic0106]|uniref:mobile mystery protein A n=1 Tax=Chitinophaga sp. sic0106 TaxID=2854785 RepID=UPI001C457D82|nr:mobile mystery protein A [Chitinophaga sp. sic0106]MBV7533974.1 mobile mystery protein A [Chitinophaga sp. sic0106]